MKKQIERLYWGWARLWDRLTHRVHFINEDLDPGEVETGNKTYKATAAIATKFFVVKIGADSTLIAASAADTDIPLGICTDEADAANDLVNVALFGCANGTVKAVANAAITLGDLVISAGNGKVKTITGIGAGTYYIIGRALQSAAADGDVIELAHCLPTQRVVT